METWLPSVAARRRKGGRVEGGEVSERWDLDLQEDVVGARVEWRERFPSVAVILRNKSSEFRGVIQYGLARASNAYTNFHSERHSTLSKLQPFRVISSTERASLVRCITGRRWILISSFYDTVVAQIRAIKNSIPLENLWVHRWISSIIDIRDIVIAVMSDRKSKTRCSLKFPSIPRYARFPNSMDFSTNQISFFRPGWTHFWRFNIPHFLFREGRAGREVDSTLFPEISGEGGAWKKEIPGNFLISRYFRRGINNSDSFWTQTGRENSSQLKVSTMILPFHRVSYL